MYLISVDGYESSEVIFASDWDGPVSNLQKRIEEIKDKVIKIWGSKAYPHHYCITITMVENGLPTQSWKYHSPFDGETWKWDHSIISGQHTDKWLQKAFAFVCL